MSDEDVKEVANEFISYCLENEYGFDVRYNRFIEHLSLIIQKDNFSYMRVLDEYELSDIKDKMSDLFDRMREAFVAEKK